MEKLTASSVEVPELRFVYCSLRRDFAEVTVAPRTWKLVLPEATAKDTQPEVEHIICVQRAYESVYRNTNAN